MAAPLSPDQLLAALRAEGVNVREYPGWRTHSRDAASGRPFGPVNGIVIHHTAGRDSLALCVNGTASLPGPLCHTHLSKAGVATMLSAGRANHAGTFAQNAHDAVVAESATHPRPDSAEPVDGNDHYYGIEIENLGDGIDPYPIAQYDQAVRWGAALCRAHGWTADSVIGHKEGTRRKIDPSFSMRVFRFAVAERLKHPAGWSPETSTPEEEEMALSAEDKAWIEGAIKRLVPVAVLTTDGIIDNPVKGSENTHISLETSVRNIETVARRTEAKVIGLGAPSVSDAQVAALAEALAAHPKLAALIAEKVVANLAARLAG